MLKVVDRIFGCLLALAACGHTVGTILWTQPMSGIFIWSLGSSLAAGLLAVLNIVRAGRPDDKTLAVITAVGTALWALVAFAFGVSIHNVLDPRPLGHVTISMILVIFSAITLRQSSTEQPSALNSAAAAMNRRA
jgi:acid phosphatase family membrane protein YuiD